MLKSILLTAKTDTMSRKGKEKPTGTPFAVDDDGIKWHEMDQIGQTRLLRRRDGLDVSINTLNGGITLSKEGSYLNELKGIPDFWVTEFRGKIQFVTSSEELPLSDERHVPRNLRHPVTDYIDKNYPEEIK